MFVEQKTRYEMVRFIGLLGFLSLTMGCPSIAPGGGVEPDLAGRWTGVAAFHDDEDTMFMEWVLESNAGMVSGDGIITPASCNDGTTIADCEYTFGLDVEFEEQSSSDLMLATEDCQLTIHWPEGDQSYEMEESCNFHDSVLEGEDLITGKISIDKWFEVTRE